MSTQPASSYDHEGLPEQSRSTRFSKAGSVKPPAKKAPAGQTQKTLSGVVEPEGKTPPGNGEVHAHIAERAYELYHRRGGHQGQDLDDWFAAEQEIVAEDS